MVVNVRDRDPGLASDYVTLPRYVVEWLLDTAREHRANNEYKRGTTYKNSATLAEMDDHIRGTEQYLSTDDGDRITELERQVLTLTGMVRSAHKFKPITLGPRCQCEVCQPELWEDINDGN